MSFSIPSIRRLLLLAAAILLVTLSGAPASAEIADRLDEAAVEVACSKWWGIDQTRVDKLRGRVVVVHFSKPELVTSKAALVPLRKLVDGHPGAPLTVVEVIVSADEAIAADYVATVKPTWSVGFDGNGTAAARWPGSSVPRTYMIGPDGRIAWHAHIVALTEPLLQAQLQRVLIYAPSSQLKAAKSAQKLAAEMRYKAALDECDKVDTEKYANEADRDVVKAIRAEVDREFKFLYTHAVKLADDRDYGLAWRRLERLAEIYKGTAHETEIAAKMAELKARDIVPYVIRAQDDYDKLSGRPARSAKQIKDLISELEGFIGKYGEEVVPGERALKWKQELVKQLAEVEAAK